MKVNLGVAYNLYRTMKKFLVLSVSLSLLLTACSVESDSEKIAQKKEQHLTQNKVSDLANAALDLEQKYKVDGETTSSIADIIVAAQDLAMAPEFISMHNLQTGGYVQTSVLAVNNILDLDESVILQSSYSIVFKEHVIDILNGQNIEGFKEIVNMDQRLSSSQKEVLLNAIDFSLVSNEHGVDDEWRKRKFMGYILTQHISGLNVVITATVLNIAMKQ